VSEYSPVFTTLYNFSVAVIMCEAIITSSYCWLDICIKTTVNRHKAERKAYVSSKIHFKSYFMETIITPLCDNTKLLCGTSKQWFLHCFESF